MDVAQQSSSLMQLSDEDLMQIARLIDCEDRRLVLPLVSKRWAQLLGVPSAAWETVIIDMTDQELVQSDVLNMVAWFGARSGSVAWLRVMPEGPHHCILPRTVVLDILMTQAASLRGLVFQSSAVALSSADTSVLLELGALEMLHIIMDCAAGWVDHAALIETLCLLPALQRVDIRGEESSMFGQGLPSLVEMATLHSTSLNNMRWSVADTPGNIVLGALPALRRCTLTWGNQVSEDYTVELSAGSFRGASGLMILDLTGAPNVEAGTPGARLVMGPNCFDSLSALRYLSLRNCRLVEVPPALLGVQRTLRYLDLFGNPLVVDNAGLDILLCLSSLDVVIITEWEELGIVPRIDTTKFGVLLPGESYADTVKSLSRLLRDSQLSNELRFVRMLCLCASLAEEAAAGLAAERTRKRNRDKKARQRGRKAAVAAAPTAAAASAAAIMDSLVPTREQGQAAGAFSGPATAYVAEGSQAGAAKSAALHPPPAAPATQFVLADSMCSSSNSGSRAAAGGGSAVAVESISPSGIEGDAEASAGSNLNVLLADTGDACNPTASVDDDDDDDVELQALLFQLMRPHESAPAPYIQHCKLPIAVPLRQPPVTQVSAVTDVQPAACSAAVSAGRASRQAAAAETISYLLCPLTKVQLVDPVIAADGQTYERTAMERWLATHAWSTTLLSPVTGEAMPHAHLLPNLAVRSLLQDGA